MGSALNILILQGLPRLSKKSPTFAWSALFPEDASFSVSVSLFGVSQAKDSVISLWALAPLLNQKLPEDRGHGCVMCACVRCLAHTDA